MTNLYCIYTVVYLKENVMNTYFIYGMTSADFASGMLTKPHDRLKTARALALQFNCEVVDFFYTNGAAFNFLVIARAESDEIIEAQKNIVLAAGSAQWVAWSRAFNAKEYQTIFETAKEGMASYVTSLEKASEEKD
jgi:uncharacterized protein with GYD domain